MTLWGKFLKRTAPDKASGPRVLKLEAVDRVYAIGDIHGCHSQLVSLEAKISDDIAESPDLTTAILYLGDFVDRGPASAHVLDHLSAPSNLPAKRYFLRGNHEEFFEGFLERPTAMLDWLSFGAVETLSSYGIYTSPRALGKMRDGEIQRLMQACIPEAHVQFLGGLWDAILWDDYLFCHAGVDPTKPLSQQTREDFLWARDRFMSQDVKLGPIVVHGHTPVTAPQVGAGRISIDTHAYAGGPLTAVCLLAAAQSSSCPSPRFLMAQPRTTK